MGGKYSNLMITEACLLLFLLSICVSKCCGHYNDGLQLNEREHCERSDGARGVCVLPENCISDPYAILKLSKCSDSRAICCPKPKSGLSSRHRRHSWYNAPYFQTQYPTWQNSRHDNYGHTPQNYHNGYNYPNFGYHNYGQNWNAGYNNGQNDHNDYKDPHSRHGYDYGNWNDGYHNDHFGHNEENCHDEHAHDRNEKERSNYNLQNNYDNNNYQNINNGHVTLQNDDMEQAMQNSSLTNQNPMTIGEDSIVDKADGDLPRSQTSTVTNQVENTTPATSQQTTQIYMEPNPIPAAFMVRRISERKCVEYRNHMKNLVTNNNVMEKGRCTWHGFKYLQTPFVYRGMNTTVAEFPHMVALGWPLRRGGYDFKCGGTLISETYVLTAGHCLEAPNEDRSLSLAPTVVRLGDFVLDDNVADGSNPITIAVKRTITHPSYMPPNRYFDIGLIELAQSVEISLEIRPACLWTEPGFGSYGNAVVTGWGRLSARGARAAVLQKASLELYENSFCAPLLDNVRNRNWRFGLVDHQLCAGDLKNGTDTCQGDSGSALAVAYKDNQCLFFVMGVTSFGRPCGTLNSPGVYTRVSSFVDWIESIVWGGSAEGDFVFPLDGRSRALS